MAFGVATVLTSIGKAITAKRMIGATPAQITPNFQGIGVGATGAARTAVAGDAALSSEVETRVSTNPFTTVTTSVTNDTAQCIQTTTATGARAVDEAGLFDAVTTGNMYMSATFNVVNLANGDSIQITWKCQYT